MPRHTFQTYQGHTTLHPSPNGCSFNPRYLHMVVCFRLLQIICNLTQCPLDPISYRKHVKLGFLRTGSTCTTQLRWVQSWNTKILWMMCLFGNFLRHSQESNCVFEVVPKKKLSWYDCKDIVQMVVCASMHRPPTCLLLACRGTILRHAWGRFWTEVLKKKCFGKQIWTPCKLGGVGVGAF